MKLNYGSDHSEFLLGYQFYFILTSVPVLSVPLFLCFYTTHVFALNSHSEGT